jgi:hypothetical protein
MSIKKQPAKKNPPGAPWEVTGQRRREGEEWFTAAFNFNPDAVAISEADTGRILMVNPL